jgi:hypothetical protein
MRTEIVHRMVRFTIEKNGDESPGNLKSAAFSSRYFSSRGYWRERNI